MSHTAMFKLGRLFYMSALFSSNKFSDTRPGGPWGLCGDGEVCQVLLWLLAGVLGRDHLVEVSGDGALELWALLVQCPQASLHTKQSNHISHKGRTYTGRLQRGEQEGGSFSHFGTTSTSFKK